SWTWDEFRDLPTERVTVDIHCVTRWSKLDTTWQGVSVDTLLSQVSHQASYVLAHCDGGYTTNLPLADVTGGPARGALHHRRGPRWGGLGLRRRAAGSRARRPGPAAGAAPVLLEERQVGAPARAAGPRRARLLGDLRVQHVRRPMEGTAVRGRLTWQVATVDQ